MARFFIELSYHGARYGGWQVQPNAVSVQGVLAANLSQLLNVPIEVVGCGRTDAGVHARQYYAHFDSPTQLPPQMVYRLNKMLPPDIALRRCIAVSDDAHARYDATYRAYEYQLHFTKNVFATDRSYYYHQQPLDVEQMQAAAQLLLQYNDFRAFCKTDSDAKHYLCTLYESQLTTDPQQHSMCYRIAANRFLRGMVRLVVGSLLAVGKHQISLSDYARTLEQQLPRFAGVNYSAPPQGLALVEVRYPFVAIEP